MIVSGDGTELTSNAVPSWSGEARVESHYVAQNQSMQNGYVESFNGRMRDELLDESVLLSLARAHGVIQACTEDYNTERPHSLLSCATRRPSPPRSRKVRACTTTNNGLWFHLDESCIPRKALASEGRI